MTKNSDPESLLYEQGLNRRSQEITDHCDQVFLSEFGVSPVQELSCACVVALGPHDSLSATQDILRSTYGALAQFYTEQFGIYAKVNVFPIRYQADIFIQVYVQIGLPENETDTDSV